MSFYQKTKDTPVSSRTGHKTEAVCFLLLDAVASQEVHHLGFYDVPFRLQTLVKVE